MILWERKGCKGRIREGGEKRVIIEKMVIMGVTMVMDVVKLCTFNHTLYRQIK